jgi:hypothetical protein
LNIKFLYKFGKREHLERITEGCVRFMPAKYYQDKEDKDGYKGVGDSLDTVISISNEGENKFKLLWGESSEELKEHVDVSSLRVSPKSVSMLPVFCFSYASEENMIYHEKESVWELVLDSYVKAQLIEMCKKENYDSVITLPFDDFAYRLNEYGKKHCLELGMGNVQYFDDSERQRKCVELLKGYSDFRNLCFIKESALSYQCEFRFIVCSIQTDVAYPVKLRAFDEGRFLVKDAFEFINNRIFCK